MNTRIGGILTLKINGETHLAKGSFTYNIGVAKKEMIAGSDGIHGFKELPVVPYIEGIITDTDGLDLETLQSLRDVTVTLDLANGKTIVVEQAIFAGDGNATTEEGEITARFEGIRGREIS